MRRGGLQQLGASYSAECAPGPLDVAGCAAVPPCLSATAVSRSSLHASPEMQYASPMNTMITAIVMAYHSEPKAKPPTNT